jgi:hypothetical protein
LHENIESPTKEQQQRQHKKKKKTTSSLNQLVNRKQQNGNSKLLQNRSSVIPEMSTSIRITEIIIIINIIINSVTFLSTLSIRTHRFGL